MFSGAIFFFKYCSVRTNKLHKMKKNIWKKYLWIVFRLRNFFNCVLLY
jgi:hypothetical protein